MSLGMLFRRETFEVLESVIEGVAVDVVDVEARWLRSVVVLPDLFVKPTDASRSMSPVWREVDSRFATV